MPRVLIVEDEAVLRLTFQDYLQEDGYEVQTASNFDEAKPLLESDDFDVIVSDIILGGKTGVDLLRWIQSEELGSSVIMITGDPSVETASEVVRLGAFDYLVKPVKGPSLKRVVRLAADRKRLTDERDSYARQIDQYRRELDTVFNSVNVGIVTVDGHMRVGQVNRSAQKLFGINSEKCRGMSIDKCLPASSKPALDALRNTLVSRTGSEELRVEVVLDDSMRRVVVFSAAPLTSNENGLDGAVLFARDITRLTELERQLSEEREYKDFVGKSSKMKDIFRLIEDLSETDSTVLVYGESGTGKELVATALHESSSRAEKPFVKVNCAALSEDILESELFGHVKGAFTGAVKDRYGRFETANGGTILLDEIGDISPRLQLRLLRVLQEGEFERVGASTPVRVDVRVIAATNQDLLAKIRAGEFRQDLYYRLNVVRMEIPPLREHREDIPHLVDHFCERFNKAFKRNVRGLAPETMEIFMSYPWLGNVRELENCLERAFIVCHDELIMPAHLPSEVADHGGARLVSTMHQDAGLNNSGIDKDQALLVLNQTDWNVAKSARRLGIARNTLYQKMRLFNLSRPTGE